MARLFDPKKDGKYPFEYRDSSSTDVRLTWARAREKKKEIEREQVEKLRQITKGKVNGPR